MSEHLLDRIYGEYQAYKAFILSLSNAEIFAKCYEIDVMTNFYNILSECVKQFSGDTIQTLLGHQSILAELYDKWLKRDDMNYAEMENYLLDEIDNMKA